jgi:hypothetical protein
MSSGSLGSSASLTSGSSSQVQSDKHGIRLKKFTQEKFVINNVDGFRMKIVAYDANNMSNYIFRYIRGPFSATTGAYFEELDGVCSPADLEEFPVDSPLDNANPAWFRKDYIDLVFRSQTTAEEAWDRIVKDVSVLVSSLDKMDVIKEEKIVAIGDPLI